MFSKPQNHHTSTPRPNFDIIPSPLNIKNMPNLTQPFEFPENPQIQLKNYKNKLRIWEIGSPPRETKTPPRETRDCSGLVWRGAKCR